MGLGAPALVTSQKQQPPSSGPGGFIINQNLGSPAVQAPGNFWIDGTGFLDHLQYFGTFNLLDDNFVGISGNSNAVLIQPRFVTDGEWAFQNFAEPGRRQAAFSYFDFITPPQLFGQTFWLLVNDVDVTFPNAETAVLVDVGAFVQGGTGHFAMRIYSGTAAHPNAIFIGDFSLMGQDYVVPDAFLTIKGDHTQGTTPFDRWLNIVDSINGEIFEIKTVGLLNYNTPSSTAFFQLNCAFGFRLLTLTNDANGAVFQVDVTIGGISIANSTNTGQNFFADDDGLRSNDSFLAHGKQAWQLGTIVNGAVALDVANYIEVAVNGIIHKLLIST